MFLLRLMYLKKINTVQKIDEKNNQNEKTIIKNDNLIANNEEDNLNLKNKTINEIKNISQPKNETKLVQSEIKINDFNDLINLCNENKGIIK